MSATSGSLKICDMSHSKSANCNDSLRIVPSKPSKLNKHTLSFHAATVNTHLARRLNKKKIECRSLRDAHSKLKIQLVNYKRYILQLTNQKDDVHSELTNIVDELASSYDKMSAAMDGFAKVRDNIAHILGRGDQENTSYLANTSVFNDLQNLAKETKSIKCPSGGKLNKKAVNMVRPMKYGFVVGNPVVSLRRLRRPILPPVPLEVVEEDDDDDDDDDNEEEEEEETADVNITAVEIAPTPSGLPSPSSPEAASTSATPEPTLQTSPFSETTRSSPHQTTPFPLSRTRYPRDNEQDSVKSRRLSPKNKQPRESLSVNLSVAKSEAIENQHKKNFTPSRRTTNSERTSVTPILKLPDITRTTISKNQEIQLMTPCRVMVKNLQNLNVMSNSRHSLTEFSQRRYSPRPSYVLLDRITMRKKPTPENDTDSDDSDDSIYKLDIEVKEENVTLNESRAAIETVDLNDLSQSIDVSSLESSSAVQGKQGSTAMSDNEEGEEEEEEDVIRSQENNHELSNQDSLENSADTTILKSPTPCIVQIKLKTGSNTDSSKSDSSDAGENIKAVCQKKRNSTLVPKILKIPTTKRLIKNNRPMPLSKKLKLCKDFKAESSNHEKSPITKKSFFSINFTPEQNLLGSKTKESKSERKISEPLFDDKSVKNMTLCDTVYSSDSSDSSGSSCLSPDQRRSYMKEFLTRVKSEDPLEGTSKKFEPKKKSSSTAIKKPAKKSLRIREKKSYTESPDSPGIVKPLDESWRPLASKKRPKPLSKKKDSHKKTK